jgi:hypothetical protein
MRLAAFLSISQFDAPANATLIVSQFTGDPIAPDALGAVYNLAEIVKNPSMAVVNTLTDTIVWPNDYIQLNASSGVSQFNGILLGGGFLVPPKTVGAVTFVEMTNSGAYVTHTNVSTDLGSNLFGGWFYHKALLRDVDGDGFKDVIAARAFKPIFGTPAGELVWMRQPPNVSNPLAAQYVPWKETVLVK